MFFIIYFYNQILYIYIFYSFLLIARFRMYPIFWRPAFIYISLFLGCTHNFLLLLLHASLFIRSQYTFSSYLLFYPHFMIILVFFLHLLAQRVTWFQNACVFWYLIFIALVVCLNMSLIIMKLSPCYFYLFDYTGVTSLIIGFYYLCLLNAAVYCNG